MNCRPSRRAALIALGLMLAGCAGEGAAPTVAEAQGAGDSAGARLLDQANAGIAKGSLAEAGALLDQARANDPDNPDPWVAIARLRFRGGEHLTAIEAADQALALGPDHPPALLLRALMVRDAHGFGAALPWFAALLAADPDNPDGWAEYAATLGDMGHAREMLAAVRRLAEVAPADPRVFYLQAVLAARGGEPAIARSLLLRSGMAARRVPAAMLLDAALHLEQGNPDSAVEVLETLAARQPANARARELLARALFDSGREAELIARFAAEARRPETSPYLLMLLARAHERRGDRASAAPLLERAYRSPRFGAAVLADRPGLPPPTARLRRTAAARDWGGAVSAAQGMRTRFPASADMASLAGDSALGAGDARSALAHYAQGLQVRRPWRLAGSAVLATQLVGNPEAAAALLARHVAGEPDNLDAVTQLAAEQARAGDWARAALLLDHTIALGGAHDPMVLGLRLRAARALGDSGEAERFARLLAELTPPALALR